MSTILKAAQELERDAGMMTPPVAPPEFSRRPQLLRIAVLLLAVIAAGLSVVLLLVLTRQPAPPAPATAAPALPAAAMATPRSVRQPLPPVDSAPRIRAEVIAPAAARPVAPRPAAAPQERSTTQRSRGSQPPAAAPRALANGGSAGATGAPSADEEELSDAEADEGLDDESAVTNPRPRASAGISVPGEPGLQVKSLAYSANVQARSVALQLAGGREVNLHEGESSGGVEVQLIMPNVVYLRKGGSVIAVSVPSRSRQ